MIGSLAVVLTIVHLPLAPGSTSVGWHQIDRLDREVIELHDVAASGEAEAGVPPTRFGERETLDGDEELEAPETPAQAENDRPQRIPGLKVMSAATHMPKIVGGLGAFYLHIEYPEEAVRNRIEGRLMLSFLVDADGRTDNVRVVESLHPLCDSAAVAALRKTRFVPGRSEGEPVAIRMNLPVRFRLVSPQ